MCGEHLSWEASDGEKGGAFAPSTPNFDKFCFFIAPPSFALADRPFQRQQSSVRLRTSTSLGIKNETERPFDQAALPNWVRFKAGSFRHYLIWSFIGVTADATIYPMHPRRLGCCSSASRGFFLIRPRKPPMLHFMARSLRGSSRCRHAKPDDSDDSRHCYPIPNRL